MNRTSITVMFDHNYLLRIYLNTTGRTTVIISLERSSYTVSEASGFVEVCAVLEGLGVEEGVVTVDIRTENISAIGKPTGP